jgi:5-methylcytosine-specific restriction endonuclease McrA
MSDDDPMSWYFQSDDTDNQPSDNPDNGMLSVRHYLLYWKVTPDERTRIAECRSTAYAASSYLKRVRPGDVLWIINVAAHRLYLLGRLKVEFVVDDTSVAQELVEPQPETWEESDWYAISHRYNIEPMRAIDITGLAPQLRFASETADRLDVQSGKVDAHQLTTLREIIPETAAMLDDVWYNDAYVPQSIQDYLELSEDDRAYSEGKTVVRTVRQRQRSRKLVAEAKARFRTLHNGRLYCEVCGFDFDNTYGIEYIEAHHTEPIASLENPTDNTTDDLVLLCANCHRAIHSRTPPYTLHELKQMIQQKDENIS